MKNGGNSQTDLCTMTGKCTGSKSLNPANLKAPMTGNQ
jgi:hypothetical protein